MINRSAVMKDAWGRYRRRAAYVARHGANGQELTFGECLSRAWEAARLRQSQVIAFRTAPRSRAGYRRAA